ncbi:MAG: ATP-binding protein [Planctomycetaceae bacterium]|nr:ATP-binding protein [Planctomycetaceae bacterium]
MTIRPRERTAVIQSLAAGVVPSIGLQHIQVGRVDEVAALVNDLQLVEQGSSTIRFIVGRFGSGKTFFLNLIRSVALNRRFVAVQGDITTERRLHGSGGQARSLFGELMKNLATQSKPEGGALQNLVERWVGDQEHDILSQGGTEDDVARQIMKKAGALRNLVNGFDFTTVLERYYQGHRTHNEEMQAAAIRWLRAEYTTKQQARAELGVRSIIDDETFYESLKLLAAFVRLAGYKGLLILLDELVVLSHRLNNTISRNNNYESILRILNDCLQGQTEGLAFLFAGTDECLEDRRRGLFSYEALATRLAPNRFVQDGRKDLAGPVIKLDNLTPEDCYVLLRNIRNVFAGGDPAKHLVPDEAILAYLKQCKERMGASYYQTPRDTVKDFAGMLRVLEQNPKTDWRTLVQQAGRGSTASSATSEPPSAPRNPDPKSSSSKPDDDLTGFRL